MLDVCICAHNPRLEILSLVVKSLACQTVGPGAFRVLVIDNASSPAISPIILDPLREAGIESRIILENKLGLTRARLRAIDETRGEWILFVDDDNELSPHYIEEGLIFLSSRDDIGCFAGKLLLPPEMNHASWTTPFFPYLGIKDAGDRIIVGQSPEWGIWEPPGAGAFVRRALLGEYRTRARQDSRLCQLGRKGATVLASHDDSMMMRGAYRLGFSCAYNPRLLLYHHLGSNRLKFRYLLRLLYHYGTSGVILESILKGPRPRPTCYADVGAFGLLLLRTFVLSSKRGFPFALGKVAYHLGARAEHRRPLKEAPEQFP